MQKPMSKMTTRQIKKKLKIAELPTSGSRADLEKRFHDFRQRTLAEAGMSSSEDEELPEPEGASAYPAIVMIDEETGNRYMRLVEQKGLGKKGGMDWLVKDIHAELKSWGHPGGAGNKLILKSDGENAIVALRESVAKLHGGNITPEQPPKGEHASNGTVEEAGRTVRDMARVLKVQIETKSLKSLVDHTYYRHK